MARRRLFNQCFYITYENTKYFPCIEIFSTLPMATANLAPEGGEFVFSLTSSHVWEVAAAQSHPFFNIIEVDGVAVMTSKVTGESGTHVIKVRVSANPGTNPRQNGLYVTQFLNKDHMSAATGSLFSGDLYSRRITMNVFEQGSGAYVLIDNRTEVTENISYDTTSRQYTITSRGGWHFVDASIGQSCTSDITGVTTTDEDTTIITVTYGQNTGGSDREFLFQIVSNQDSSIVASAVISQAGLVLLDLERVDNDTLPWAGTNLDDTTTWPSLPQYYQYWSPLGGGYVYTYSGSNLINVVTANTSVDLTLPSRISVSENPITGSGSYSKQISFSGAALDSGLTDDTGYTYLMTGVSSVDSSVQDTVSFHYEPWPYIEVVPNPAIVPGQGQGGETHGGNDGYEWTGGTFIVNSACTGFSFELASNYDVHENPYADTNDLFNVTLTGRKVDITFKYNPETASTDVTRWADFVVSGLSGPIVLRRFPITRQAAQHTVTHYFEVLPATATISSAGTLQLTALYHTVTDGVDDGGVNVTTSTTWVDMSDTLNPFFTVGRNTGLVTGTNTIENAQTGRVVATYNTYTGETSITVLGTGTTTYYLEVTPATATIGPTGTTNLTAKFYTVINGVTGAGVDVTSLATWSSDNTAATVSAGVVTGQNNNPNSSAVANITATYNGYSDVSEITVQPAVITYNYFIIRPLGSIRLTTGDTVNGQPVTAEITKYINGVEAETLDVTSATTWGVSDSSVITVGAAGTTPQHVYPVYESGTYYPNDRTAELSGTYVINGQTFSDTQSFVVSPEGRVEYLLTVTPPSTSLALNETQQLEAIYYTITDGVSDTGVNVTNLATYSNYDTSLITVSSNGLITDINAGSEASTTITVAYGNADNVTVSVLTRDTQTTHTLVLSPASDSCTVSGNVQYTLVYITYVNGTETDRQTLSPSTAITWDITDDDNVANFNISNNQMFIENLSTSDSYVSLQAVYQGVSSNVASVTAYGATNIERYLRIEPDEDPISYTGSTQLYVSAVTVVNGSQYKTVSVDARWVTWSHDGQSINLDNTGYIVANNTAHTDEVINISGVYHAYAYDEATGTTTLTVEAKPDEVNYRIDLFLNGNANETVAWNGTIYITAELYKEVNGVKEEIISALTTEDGLIWGIHANEGYGTEDDATWDPTTQILAGHNLSNRTSSWNCTASYTFRSGGTTVYAVSHNHNANFTSASSIVYGLIVDADSDSVAYNGSTPVSATYVTIVEGDIYEPASVDVTTDAGTVWSVSPTGYGSVSNGTFYGNNLTDTDRTITVTAVYNSETDSTTIEVLAWPDEITHDNLRLAQDTATTATTISLTSGGSDSHYGLYWDEYNHNVFVESQNVTQYGSYSLYSGSTLLATFDCSATGTRYSDAFLDISYTNVNGITFSAHNDDHENKAYNLVSQRTGMNASTSINIEKAPDVITHRVELTPSGSTTIAWNGTLAFTAYYVTVTNGTESNRQTLTSGDTIVWGITGLNEYVDFVQSAMTLSAENLTTSALTVDVGFSYSGCSVITPTTVIVNPPSSLGYRLDVTAASSSVTYNGSTQLTAVYWTVINGSDYQSETVTTSTNWTDDSQYASVNSSGVFTASNNTNSTQTVTVTGEYNGATGTTTIEVGRQPQSLTYVLELLPTSTGTSSWSGNVEFGVTYYTYDNDVLVSTETVPATALTGAWNISADVTTTTIAPDTKQLYFENVSTSTGQIRVTVSYQGTMSNASLITVAPAPSVDYVLEVTVDKSPIDCTETTQANAIYKIMVDTTYVYFSESATSATSWSVTNGSAYASIGQNTGTITGTNQTMSAQSVTIQGVYKNATGTTDITVNRVPVVVTYELEVTPNSLGTQPYSGASSFTATWWTLEDNVRTVSADVTSNATWTIGTTGGTFVVSANTGNSVEWKNLSSTSGKVGVYASYTVSNVEYTARTEFNVSGVSITTAITLLPATTSVTYSNTVDYQAVITISHDGNQVYSTIIDGTNFDNNNMSISSNEATYGLVNGYPMRFENTNNTASDKTATVTFTWVEATPTYLPANTVLTAQATAEVVKQVVVTYEFEVTPPSLETQPYSGSQQFEAKVWTLKNGTRTTARIVTANATWSCTDDNNKLSVLSMDTNTNGLVHFVNLTTGASNTGQVTVTATYNGYSGSVTFNVEGLNSLTYSVSLSPDGAIVNYGENQDYYAEVIVYHNGITVYRGEYFMESDEYRSGDTGEGLFSSEDDTIFEQNGDCPARFQNKNSDTYQVVMGVTFAWIGPENLVPAGTIIEDSVTAVLNPYDAPPTYSVTFSAVNPASIDTLSYSLNMGTTQNNSNVSALTISNLDSGDIIAWSAVSSGYVTVVGSTLVTGNNTIPINMVQNSFAFRIGPSNSGDTNVNTFNVSASTTSGYSIDFILQCSGSGSYQVITLPNNYVTNNNDKFTFTVTRGSGDARIYDWGSTGSLNFSGVDPADLNDHLSGVGFSYATEISLKYNGQYTYAGSLTFVLDNPPAGFYMDCTIYRSANSAHTTFSPVTVPSEEMAGSDSWPCYFDCNILDRTAYYRFLNFTNTSSDPQTGWIDPRLTVRRGSDQGPVIYQGIWSGCNEPLTDVEMDNTWWILSSSN